MDARAHPEAKCLQRKRQPFQKLRRWCRGKRFGRAKCITDGADPPEISSATEIVITRCRWRRRRHQHGVEPDNRARQQTFAAFTHGDAHAPRQFRLAQTVDERRRNDGSNAFSVHLRALHPAVHLNRPHAMHQHGCCNRLRTQFCSTETKKQHRETDAAGPQERARDSR